MLNKLINLGMIIAGVSVVALSLINLIWEMGFPGLQPLLLAIFVILLAFGRYHKDNQRRLVFWALIAAGALNIMAAILAIWSHWS